MGTYQTSKCGHCNVHWSYMEYGTDSACGPPLIKCNTCGGLNKTKMKLYRDMTVLDKILFWAGRGLIKPIYGLFIIGFGLGIMYWQYFTINDNGQSSMEYMFEIKNWFGIILFNAIIVGVTWYGFTEIRDSFTIKKQIKGMEDLFDKNGGYLLSNEQY